MRSELEHREYSESLAAYALGALPEGESARMRRHLTDCRECRAEFEWLRVAADALPASVRTVEPPAELKRRIMGVVEAEAELLRAAGEAADRPARPRRSGAGRRFPSGWLRSGLALGAAGLAVLVLVLALTLGGTGTRTIPGRVAGHGVAALVLRNGRAQLVVRGIPLPPAGHVDQVWVQPRQGQPRSGGTFVIRSGAVDIERAVRRGDVVMVTVEPGRGTHAPTTQPFITVRV
jgi:anti-sigma-K factor RskA